MSKARATALKVLIGTPIHKVKDYAMERWVKNVAKLQRITPADLLLIDNSPTPDYVKKTESYLKKNKIKNYQILHVSTNKGWTVDLRIEYCQEVIRQYVLSHHYDAWFSWECDQIIPPNALNELIKIMQMGNFMMVVHNSWARWDPTILNTNMGITLIARKCLEKCWFLPQKSGKISLRLSDSYDVNDPTVFKKRVLRSGGHYLEVFGIIKPIYHLNK